MQVILKKLLIKNRYFTETKEWNGMEVVFK